MATDPAAARPPMGAAVTVLVTDSAFHGQTGTVAGYDVPAPLLSHDRERVIGEGTWDLRLEFAGGWSAFDLDEVVPARPYQATSFLQGIRAKVQQFGHVVIGVEAGAFPGHPQFAYTIGLAARHGYELAMSGLDVELMQGILGTLSGWADAGKLSPADKAPVMGADDNGYVLRLRPADPSWRFHWIKPVLELQEQPPVWQVEWPDADGCFRGEPGYTELSQQDFTIPVVGAD